MYTHELLVRMFVQGNVQDRFIRISLALKNFIDNEAIIIETVNTRINQFYKKPLSNFTENETEIEEYFRRDYEEATKSLRNYLRLWGTIDTNLALMSSNFRLPEFLIANGIPKEEIIFFQREVEAYWNGTYGKLVNKFSRIKEDLLVLHNTLDKEIKIIQGMPQVNYFNGFKQSEELRRLFLFERQVFWKIVEESKIKPQDVDEARKLYYSTKKQSRAVLLTYLEVIKEASKNKMGEIKQLPTPTQKAIVLLALATGAFILYLELRQNLFKIAVTKIILTPWKQWMDRREEKAVKVVSDQLITTASMSTSQSIDGLTQLL